ncbi:MAG: endonuclease/exonuclease/phosphatase [Planctomycetota bacterium]|nr:MAG: endonuclease/exonuclease/phosphatase [Planctomycetota bacterium]
MSRKLRIILMLAALVGVWFVFPMVKGGTLGSWWEKTQSSAKQWFARDESKTASTSEEPQAAAGIPFPKLPPARSVKAIRIVTFNVVPLDQEKILRPGVVKLLAEIVRRFDIAVLQGVDCRDRGVITTLVDEINAGGRLYSYATVPDPRRLTIARGTLILFDQQTVVIDRTTVWPVDDPERRLSFLPLMAAFQTRSANPEEAFTFSLVSVHIDPTKAALERELLDDIFRAVRDDGRGEDDVILVGDLGSDFRYIDAFRSLPDLGAVIVGLPTVLDGSRSVDNIVFDRRATVEYNGRFGIIDLVREFDITPEQALSVADHLPVWAEFSVREGGDL